MWGRRRVKVKASKYLPGERALQGRDEPQLSGSTQRPEWELHAFPSLAHFAKRRLGELEESPVPCATPSGQLSGPLQDSGSGAGRKDAERGGDWVFHRQGVPHLKGYLDLKGVRRGTLGKGWNGEVL